MAHFSSKTAIQTPSWSLSISQGGLGTSVALRDMSLHLLISK